MTNNNPDILPEEKEGSLNFIEQMIERDLDQKKYEFIITRFPPEPNGYLHLGHASSICLNFGLTEKYPGYTNLRFDDTNPETEETHYVESIKKDIKWLGFNWKNELYASDYFQDLFDFAVKLIKKGLAYVDDLSSDDMAKYKGTHTKPGINSPYRERSIEENLDLFYKMKSGQFEEGSKTLRAKIDMAHPNMLMRDPLMYRIKFAHHHRTKNEWSIYPMYDFAHGQSDSIEEITHSLCTLEFSPHRELYNWFIENLEIYPSHQFEFARRNINYSITSKRKLLQLVNNNHVNGWDDPRMPTISGLRRRGYTPASIREFCNRIGIAKRENLIDYGVLEFCVREDLNKFAQRRMVVCDPLKIVITNYKEGNSETLSAENNPENVEDGNRELTFSKTLFIEKEDFMLEPQKGFFRLSPKSMVRLKHAYIIQCDEVIFDKNGEIEHINCTYIPESKSGQDTSGLKVKSTLHWVNASDALNIEVRQYDRLFLVENPASEDGKLDEYINPNSLFVFNNAKGESSLAKANVNNHFQFLRIGYFILDKDSSETKMIFNKTVGLKDNWAKHKS